MVSELETVSAWELRELIEAGSSTVVVPFGSLEHHGGHLPLGADAILADAVGVRVARELGAVRAPTVRVGDSGQHQHLVGTLSLSAATLTRCAVETAHSLAAQGFGLIVLVSTHGGNRSALDAAVKQLDDSPSSAVVCAPRGDVGPHPGTYSGIWLTSVMLALRPDLVHLEHADPALATELAGANSQRGHEDVDRFVRSIVADIDTRYPSQ